MTQTRTAWIHRLDEDFHEAAIHGKTNQRIDPIRSFGDVRKERAEHAISAEFSCVLQLECLQAFCEQRCVWFNDAHVAVMLNPTGTRSRCCSITSKSLAAGAFYVRTRTVTVTGSRNHWYINRVQVRQVKFTWTALMPEEDHEREIYHEFRRRCDILRDLDGPYVWAVVHGACRWALLRRVCEPRFMRGLSLQPLRPGADLCMLSTLILRRGDSFPHPLVA